MSCPRALLSFWQEDTTFNIGLRLKMHGQSPSDMVSHDVMQTCSYTRWASKEILCDRNYMEVGHFTLILPSCGCAGAWKIENANFFFCRCQTTWLYQFNKLKLRGTFRKRTQSSMPFLTYVYHSDYSWHPAKFAIPYKKRNEQDYFFFSPQASGEAHGIWKMTFYTPEPVSMVLREAEQAGYGAMTTSSRLVMRSPYNTAETYSEDVSNTPTSPVVPLCSSSWFTLFSPL